MPTHWTVILGLTCDRCGEFITFEGQSKPEVLKMARAEGWNIEAKSLCQGCQTWRGNLPKEVREAI